MLDVIKIKKDFPIFDSNPHLTYLDSTATSLKPIPVIEKISEYYRNYPANIHRGIYKISEKASSEYEETRKIVAGFIGCDDEREIVFTRNATEALNLVTYSLGRKIIGEKDEVVTTMQEHHSNFVPWQQLALENGAIFKVIDVALDGTLDIDMAHLEKIITKRTKLLAITYISNVLGLMNPLKILIKAAKKLNPQLIVVVDATQAAPHHTLEVQEIGCDFVAFSSHKMLGPTGVGVLWGKYELLVDMFPFQYGGDMIQEVYVDRTVFKDPPSKFEAGTPHIDGIIAFKEAIRYLLDIGIQKIEQHEQELYEYGYDSLKEAFGERIRIIGKKHKEGSAILSFQLEKFHPHDVAQILDDNNIAVRAGNHCAMPLHTRFGLPASCRASFYIYNDKKDVDRLVAALEQVTQILG